MYLKGLKKKKADIVNLSLCDGFYFVELVELKTCFPGFPPVVVLGWG